MMNADITPIYAHFFFNLNQPKKVSIKGSYLGCTRNAEFIPHSPLNISTPFLFNKILPSMRNKFRITLLT